MPLRSDNIILSADLFDNPRIKQMLHVEGPEALALWIWAQTKALRANSPGVVEIIPGTPATVIDICAAFNSDTAIINSRLNYLVKAGFLHKLGEAYAVTDFEKLQKLDKKQKDREKTRLRVQRHRMNRKVGNDDVTRYTTEVETGLSR